MNPGQSSLCRECAHFSLAASDRGHPSPCRRFRWVGTRHVSPHLVDDGTTCDRFESLPTLDVDPLDVALDAVDGGIELVDPGA